MSLSARRAWIEIHMDNPEKVQYSVALRKESVDRNRCKGQLLGDQVRRSPQGERG